MIKITKGQEPHEWTLHRKTDGAKYEGIRPLRDGLLKDQGYLCAYCMRRIPVRDAGTGETSRIEHIVPQSLLTNEEAMDYRNMVICCPGAISSTGKNDVHCDRRKGELELSFSPFDEHFIGTLSYTSSGKIVSSDKEYDRELNDILNLNQKLLMDNRKEVIVALSKNMAGGKWTKSALEKIKTSFSEKDKDGLYKEYAGVVIWKIDKWLSKL